MFKDRRGSIPDAMEYNYIPKLQEWSHDALKLNLKSLMNVHLRMFLNQSSGFVMILFSNAVGNPCIDAKGKKSEIPLNNLLLNSVLNSFGPKQSEPKSKLTASLQRPKAIPRAFFLLKQSFGEQIDTPRLTVPSSLGEMQTQPKGCPFLLGEFSTCCRR